MWVGSIMRPGEIRRVEIRECMSSCRRACPHAIPHHPLTWTLLVHIYILDMPPTTRHWTSALLQVLAPFCLSAKFPWQLAFVVPALLIVDLYRRSQRPSREPIRSIVGREKRKVRRLNGRDGTVLLREEVSHVLQHSRRADA